MSKEEIFIIEDDESLLDFLRSELMNHPYQVRAACRGRLGLVEIKKRPPGLIILDLRLPDLSGWEICRLLKEDPATEAIPILILSGLGREGCIKGLDLGADSYLSKPFSVNELIARIRALFRRFRIENNEAIVPYLQLGPLVIDIERHSVRMAERALKLTPTEFQLLNYLAQNSGKVFTRDHLITALWGSDEFVEEHNLNVHIHSLRRKLESDGYAPKMLLTVRGFGYKLEVPREISTK